MLVASNLLGISTTHIDDKSLDIPLGHAVVEHYLDLVKCAQYAGFGLTAASGFRDFSRQKSIWNAKASGERPVFDDSGAIIELEHLPPKERVFAILRWSALPGASRHHWGTDFDIYDRLALPNGQVLALTVAETEVEGPFFAMYTWLEDYLKQNDCPFYRPYAEDLGGVAPEPWHLSYKPLADEYQSALSMADLHACLCRSDIMLKEIILKHLDEIFERFVLNVNT